MTNLLSTKEPIFSDPKDQSFVPEGPSPLYFQSHTECLQKTIESGFNQLLLVLIYMVIWDWIGYMEIELSTSISFGCK